MPFFGEPIVEKWLSPVNHLFQGRQTIPQWRQSTACICRSTQPARQPSHFRRLFVQKLYTLRLNTFE